MARERRRIVVAGAGFAGLTAAMAMSRRYEVTVIDPAGHFEWTPNIHEVLSRVKTEGDVSLDSRLLVERAGHRFVQAAVEAVDAGKREVLTDGGERFRYDACLLAPGADRDRKGITGAATHAIDFRGAADATRIADRLDEVVPTDRAAPVVIIGAGVSGIEALGEILRRHRDDPDLAIHVVEKESRILPDLPAALAEDVRLRCAGLPVYWHTGAGVKRVGRRAVTLDSGESIASSLTLWSAGLAPRPFFRQAGLVPDGGRWVPVSQTLQSVVAPEIFVAGDSAELPSPLRKQAYNAIDTGAYAAWNVQHFLRGRPLKDFRPSPKPLLISLGDLDTYLVAGDRILASPMLAAGKEAVYQFYMSRFSLGLPAARIAAGLLRRSGNSIRSLVLPEVLSCASLDAVRGSRIIRGSAD
ncbi:MAG: FAD-dependent oxidoreductase [Gammaproteobacteria bacterium]|jgi:NADH:ubiquinone reductase (non-electrogenic)